MLSHLLAVVSNFCMKWIPPEQGYGLVAYSEESNIMWDSVWYLLHLQMPFLELITSVPQLLAQEEAEIWTSSHNMLNVILLYLRSELEKNENVQANVGNTPNSNVIWHWRINQLSKSPWAVHKTMSGSCNSDFLVALFSRCFQSTCLEMHYMFLFICCCHINSIF